MNRPDHILVARVVAEQPDPVDKDELIADLAKAFQADNPLFDTEKFYDACWGGKR